MVLLEVRYFLDRIVSCCNVKYLQMQHGRRTASLKASYEAVAGGELAHHTLQTHHTHHDHGRTLITNFLLGILQKCYDCTVSAMVGWRIVA